MKRHQKPAATLDGVASTILDGTEMPRMYTVSETAGLFRSSDRSVIRAIESGELRATKLRRRWLIAADEVARLLRR